MAHQHGGQARPNAPHGQQLYFFRDFLLDLRSNGRAVEYLWHLCSKVSSYRFGLIGITSRGLCRALYVALYIVPVP
jgi:hypothetical protein